MIGNAQEGGNALVVVNNNGISYPSITSVANEGTGAVTIETRVPTKLSATTHVISLMLSHISHPLLSFL